MKIFKRGELARQAELYRGLLQQHELGLVSDEQVKKLNLSIVEQFGNEGLSRVKRAAWKSFQKSSR